MELSYDAQGRACVFRYEVGDFVCLRTSETGEYAMGRLGHWGRVISVARRGPSETYDIQLAGYSESRTSTLQRLTRLTGNRVDPTDRNGVPITLSANEGVRGVDTSMRQKVGGRR